MSNKLPVITELPVISSSIQIDTELLSKKNADIKLKRIDDHNSNESIKMGDGIPRKNTSVVTTKSSDIQVVTTNENNWVYIVGIILFLIIAGSSYYFYITYRKNKN